MMPGGQIPDPKVVPISQRKDIHIEYIESQYFSDLTAWFTAPVKTKYLEELARLQGAPIPAADAGAAAAAGAGGPAAAAAPAAGGPAAPAAAGAPAGHAGCPSGTCRRSGGTRHAGCRQATGGHAGSACCGMRGSPPDASGASGDGQDVKGPEGPGLGDRDQGVPLLQ